MLLQFFFYKERKKELCLSCKNKITYYDQFHGIRYYYEM